MPAQAKTAPDLLSPDPLPGEDLLEKADVGLSERVEGRIVPTGYTDREYAEIVGGLSHELNRFAREQGVAGKGFRRRRGSLHRARSRHGVRRGRSVCLR